MDPDIDDNADSDNNEKEIIKEEINLKLMWNILSFFITYLLSYFIPGIVFFSYILLVFKPYVLDTANIIALFTELVPLLSFLLIPVVLIASYLIHLFCAALIIRVLYQYTERKLPSKDGVIPRNIPSKTLDFYHIRSFMLKYPKYLFTKGIFPWLSKWAFNFIGSNTVGKGSIIEEQVCGDKYVDIGENCYIGVNSILASHVVEGIFGNINYFKIKIGDNVTFSGGNAVTPGCDIRDNSYLLPLASATKFSVLKGKNYYFGIPLRKIFKSKIHDYLQLTESDLKKDKALREKQLKSKNEKK
ncbi:MAG: hypothetical protein ACFFBP_04150 [Promethearchaeota archaeon]